MFNPITNAFTTYTPVDIKKKEPVKVNFPLGSIDVSDFAVGVNKDTGNIMVPDTLSNVEMNYNPEITQETT
jgi:hypothetical protein